MTKTDSYAKERIGFYEARFASETIHQLVTNLTASPPHGDGRQSDHATPLLSSVNWDGEE